MQQINFYRFKILYIINIETLPLIDKSKLFISMPLSSFALLIKNKQIIEVIVHLSQWQKLILNFFSLKNCS